MIYLLKFIIFTASTLLACAISDIINIKTERRIGIAKKPFLLLTRHLPGYLNFTFHILALFATVIFSSQDMKTSSEYILLPLVLIFITKLFFTNSDKENRYFETICLATILICILPVLLQYKVNSWLSLTIALLCVKIFNKSSSEPLALNMARNLTLNFYLFCVWLPFINFYQGIVLAIVTLYIQNILYTLMPKFNQTKNSKLVFVFSFLASLLVFIATSVINAFLSGVVY
jgi:hypothetical protein